MELLSKIAYITMIIDHVGKVFFPKYIIFQMIGSIAYPIFAYKISIGIDKSKNLLLFSYRVLLIGIISQYFYMVVLKQNNLNICFTLFLGIVLSQSISNYSKRKIIYTFLVTSLLIISIEGFVEYGIYGIGLIYIFTKVDILTLNIKTHIYVYIVITIYTYICVVYYNWNFIQMYSIMAIPVIILAYNLRSNERKNRSNRYIHYLIYPVHLIIIYTIKVLIK